ncbi:hypothetical protein RB195_012304 [Necator americanus]|uniref:Cyclin-like domain-containing protein n=1 Tax=Necator americanus TaxID=51031 RepID=A0ABR1D6I0_NECAM
MLIIDQFGLSDAMCSLPGSSSSDGTQVSIHKWYFTKEEAANTASIREHGFSPEKELTYRQQATRFIQVMVDQLNHNVRDQRGKISQLCMCAAIMHMHRFFCFHSFKFFDYRDIAAACLFLAGKSEECPRKLDHIVRVWWAKKFERHPTIPSSNHHIEAAQLIVQLENVILQTIAFDLKVEMPHPFVLAAMHEIANNNKKLTECAYFFATDVLCVTNWAIRYNASAIACVCVHLVCVYAGYEIPPPAPGEKAWFEKLDPYMTQDLLNEMSLEFASIYKSCREWLALTRFVAKGIVKPSTPSPNPARSPAEEKEILPPPPPPPTFHKKVDLSEYKERTKSLGPSSDRSSAERAPPRRSFIPDTSQARPDLSMPTLALPGQEPVAPSPLAAQPYENGHKSREEHSRREEERRREKERRRREERERHGHAERPEERERRKDEERRKREHDRISGGSGPHPPLEKRSRHEPPSSSFTQSSMGSSSVGSGSKPPRPMSQVQVTHHSTSHSHVPNSANGSHSRRENDVIKSSSQYCRAMEPPRALSPPPLPPSVLPPPPPPPAAIAELEDGELE